MNIFDVWCIEADIKLMTLRNRALNVLYEEYGVETGEVVVLLAIFALFATFVGNKFGGAFKDKAESIISSIGGATWSP